MKAPVRRVLLLVASACVLAGATGCSAGGGARSIAIVPGAATVDAVTGTIRLPLDAYALTGDDDKVFATANDLVASRCMSAAGYGEFLPFIDRRHGGQADVDWRYGVWVKSQVVRYGYGRVPPSALGQKLQAANQVQFTPEADAAYKRCITTVHESGIVLPDAAGVLMSNAFEEQVMATSEGKKVLSDWKKCLTDNHVPLPDHAESDWFPAGIHEAPLEQQIEVGLKDVACKEDVNMVQRLSDIEAAYENDYIKDHEAVLTDLQKANREALDRARAYLASSGPTAQDTAE